MLRLPDDPAPPAPDDRRLEAVLRRADHLAARRRHARAGVVAVLALSGVLAGVLAVTRASPPLPASQAAYDFNVRVGPLPAGTPAPVTALTDVVFLSRDRGFALAAHRNLLVLVATADGGASWSVVDGRLPGTLAAAGARAQMEFITAQEGYLWRGPDAASSAAAPLWVTGDGGETWRRAPIGPVVDDVSAIGADVWALASSCAAPGLGCAVTLEVSTDGGATWQRGPTQVPATVPGSGSPDRGIVLLARVTRQRAYVYTSAPTAGSSLAYTGDGGASWTALPGVPCVGAFGAGGQLALSGTEDLWLVCGGKATGGEQAKALYRSSDGGGRWTLAAESTGLGSGPAPAGVGRLPLRGYVAPYSVGHKTLAVLSPEDAWLFPTGGEVSVTTDGGDRWDAVSGLQAADFGSGGTGNVTFIDRSVGWVVEFGVGLWRTTDGTTWAAVGSP